MLLSEKIPPFAMIRIGLLLRLLLVATSPILGQTWNVKDSVEGLKEYFQTSKQFVQEMASHAKQGFDLVNKWEQFVSNALDEDCYYECPGENQVTVPNPNHKPSR